MSLRLVFIAGLDPSEQFKSFDRSQSPSSLNEEAADSSKDDDDVVVPGISVHMGQQLETEVSITRKHSDKKSSHSDEDQYHVTSNQSVILEADPERRNGNVVLDSSSPSSTLSADSEPMMHKRQESESQISIPSSQSGMVGQCTRSGNVETGNKITMIGHGIIIRMIRQQ